jgi:sugar lactone lactonase YvrE
MFANNVLSTDLNGHVEIVGQFDDLTSGLGFLPDGSPLVVVRRRRQILRFDGASWQLHADLTDIPATWLNDMVVDDRGRAYVDCTVRPGSGDLGRDCLVVVEPDGSHKVATTDVEGPNGLVITGDRTRLICANTRLSTLNEFQIMDDGSLTGGAIFASTAPASPDGICLDAESAVWVGGTSDGLFRRIARGGQVLQSIPTGDRWAIACVLGGPDRRTLFIATAVTTAEKLFAGPRAESEGFIEVHTVAVPGAGWP